ncbi:MAG TPA: carboxypeptidase regulatory-like domain-containing protein [Longimicrobium sp.]
MIRTMWGMALLALAAQPLDAQTVFGRVMETRSGWPVPYAAVTLVDAGGKPVGYSQSDANGEYRVEVRQPGRYVIRAERVGYRPRASALTEVREGRDVRRDLRLTRGGTRLGQEDGTRGLLPPGAPTPIPAVPPATDGGPSTSRAPAGDATAARPVPRVSPVVQPRRDGARSTARQPRPASRPSGGDRGGAKRTP